MKKDYNLMSMGILKIKIVKCSNDKYWYRDRFGEIFNVYKT